MVLIGVAGYSIERHDGYTARISDPEQPVIDVINKRLFTDYRRCLKSIPDWNGPGYAFDITACRFQRETGQNTIAVIGDSHAGQLYSGLITQTKNSEGIAVFPSECAIPLIGLHSMPQKWTFNEHLLNEGFRYILSHSNIKKVVLAHYPGCSWHNVVDVLNPSNKDFASILHDGFVRTYEALTKSGKEIYVVLDSPSYTKESFSKCAASVIKRPVGIPVFLASKNIYNCYVQHSQLRDRVPIENWNKLSRKIAASYSNLSLALCPPKTPSKFL